MKIKCVAVDDEPFALKGICQYIEKIDFLELAGTCHNPLELQQILDTTQVDLLFLDIQMPHITGIDFLKTLKKSPLVILTTAYQEYALEGYELDIVDYLLKPIPFNRFLKAVNKAKAFLQHLQNNVKDEAYFFIKTKNRIEKILTEDILFVESMQNYIHIYTSQDKFTTYYTLKGIKEELPEKQFLQTHQSYLVALNKIKAIEGNEIQIGQYKVPISKYMRKDVLEAILQHRLLQK